MDAASSASSAFRVITALSKRVRNVSMEIVLAYKELTQRQQYYNITTTMTVLPADEECVLKMASSSDIGH